MKNLFLALTTLVFLASCSGKPSLDDEKLSDREFRLEQFFAGKTKAHGQFQDILGNVSSRFEVDITGIWDGRLLTMVEDFTPMQMVVKSNGFGNSRKLGQTHGLEPPVV